MLDKNYVRIMKFTVFSGIQFIVLTIVAMFFYSGGMWTDSHSIGYSFTKNFFSDLGMTRSYLGESNLISCVIFMVTTFIVGVSLVLFFGAFKDLLKTTRSQKIFSSTGFAFGVVASFGFIGVGITPWNKYLLIHRCCVYTAFIAFMLASIFCGSAILLDKKYPKFYAGVFGFFSLSLGVYVWLLFFGPSYKTTTGEIVQALGQKFIVYTSVISLTIEAIGILKDFNGCRDKIYKNFIIEENIDIDKSA